MQNREFIDRKFYRNNRNLTNLLYRTNRSSDDNRNVNNSVIVVYCYRNNNIDEKLR